MLSDNKNVYKLKIERNKIHRDRRNNRRPDWWILSSYVHVVCVEVVRNAFANVQNNCVHVCNERNESIQTLKENKRKIRYEDQLCLINNGEQ
jgi:hypothetical protein